MKVEVGGHGHDSILDLGTLTTIRLCYLFHVLEDHRRDLLRLETFLLSVDIHAYERLVLRPILHGERPELFIFLDDILIVASTNESFNIVNSVLGISRGLVLCGLANKALAVTECHVAGCYVVTHIVLDDVHLIFAPNTYARISRAQINANPRFSRI